MCGVCAPAGGLPRRCRLGECQRYPAGGVPALSPACPAFGLLSCPHPPSPLPGGKGEIFCFLMQGAAPLASPGLNPGGTGSPCRCGKLNGGLPRRCRRGGRQRYPAGGVPALPPANPAFSLLFRPYPPQPPSRREGGDYRLFYARGFAPCIPGAEPARHWFALPLWKTQWGLAPALSARRASAVPGGGRACFVACLPCHCGARGGLPALSPANPAFNLLFRPHPPAPLPGGKGVTKVILCKGLRPLHPRG